MTISPRKIGQRRDRLLFLGSGLFLIIIVLMGFAKAQRWGTKFVDIYIKSSDVNGLNFMSIFFNRTTRFLRFQCVDSHHELKAFINAMSADKENAFLNHNENNRMSSAIKLALIDQKPINLR